MSKNNIIELVNLRLGDFLSEKGLYLYNVDYVKEGRDWYLRVFVDRQDEEYISIEECEQVSARLSEILDKEDPIEDNYFLEVSSPGMDRPLLTDEHFKKYQGKIIDVKLYKAIDGKKEYQGELLGLRETEDGGKTLAIKCQVIEGAENRKKGQKINPNKIHDEELTFPMDLVCKVNLAVIF